MATLLHISLVLLLLVTTFLEETKGFFGGDKVLLRDIRTLTLYSGKMTTGGRSSAVNQLKCVGGSAGCSAFTPQVIQCYNRGFDGFDVQWECKTDMDNSYRFGRIDVTCEGYSHPDDEYVLKGSCGVEYTLDLTKAGQQSNQYKQQHSYYGNDNSGSGSYGSFGHSGGGGGIGDWIMLAVVGVIIYGLYRTCIATSTNNSDYPDDGHQDGNNRWGQGRGNGGNPPGSGPGYPPDSCSGTRGNTRPGTGSMGGGGGVGGGGFWSGAAAGGLLGYMFGNRGGGYGGYGGYGRPRYGYGGRSRTGFGSGWGGSGFGGGGSSFGGGGGGFSTGTRTASGFGGTRRR